MAPVRAMPGFAGSPFDGRQRQKPVDDLCMGRRDLLWIVRWKDLWTVAQQVFEHNRFSPSNQVLGKLAL
jgi:hypothetical protein